MTDVRQKKIGLIIAVIAAVCCCAVIIGTIGFAISNPYEDQVFVESFENVQLEIDALATDDGYINADEDEKVILMQNCLEKLQNAGKISNLHYDNYVFHFNYADYGFGGVAVEDTHDDCWGDSPLGSEWNRMLSQNFVKNFFNSFARENWLFIFGDSTVNSVTYDEIESLVREFNNDDTLKIKLKTDTTVSTYTNLESKDLIYISAHGFFDEKENRQLIWTQEKVTDQYKKNKKYKKLLREGDIGVYYKTQNGLVDKNESYFVIAPQFFQDYYDDDELNGSIVLLGVCSAFGNNDKENYQLALSLRHAGAGSVIGFCNTVNQGYSVLFYNSVITSYLGGQTIGEAFDNAKATIGENENEYYNIYTSFEADDFPAYPILSGETDARFDFSDSTTFGETTFCIKDANSNEGIPNVSVTIKNREENFSTHDYRSDENGLCTLQLPAGQYTCTFSHADYSTTEMEITLEPNTSDAEPKEVLLEHKALAMIDFIGMTVDDVKKMFGENCKFVDNSGRGGASSRYSMYYEQDGVPFIFGVDSQTQPTGSDVISTVEYSSMYNDSEVIVEGEITSKTTYAEMKASKDPILWRDLPLFCVTYKVGDLSVDFEYQDMPADHATADSIVVLQRTWEVTEESWETETYQNYLLYQAVLDQYKEVCANNHILNYGMCSYCEFAICDINGDGVDELIVQDGTCEQNRTHHIYTIEEGTAKLIGEYNAWHLSLYDGERGDGKLIGVSGMGGSWIQSEIVITGDSLTEKTIDSSDSGDNPFTSVPNPIIFSSVQITII